jgi:4-hydroxy-2-oxoheptanedioate aldolase
MCIRLPGGRRRGQNARVPQPDAPRAPIANPLLDRWAAGEATYGGWLSTSDPLIAEYLAAAGFDEVCADQQHGSIDLHTLPAIFAAIEAHGVAPTTRVRANDFSAIGTSLDMGALGVIVPMIDTVDQAAAIVAACRYPPHGRRSAGPTRAIYRAGLSLDDLGRVAAIAMIETADGLANVEAIAAVPGLDAVYVGPGDLAIALGVPVVPDQRSADERDAHEAAIARILAAAQSAGIAAGMYIGTGAESRRRVAQGFRMVTVAWDAGLLEDGGRAELAVARGR